MKSLLPTPKSASTDIRVRYLRIVEIKMKLMLINVEREQEKDKKDKDEIVVEDEPEQKSILAEPFVREKGMLDCTDPKKEIIICKQKEEIA